MGAQFLDATREQRYLDLGRTRILLVPLGFLDLVVLLALCEHPTNDITFRGLKQALIRQMVWSYFRPQGLAQPSRPVR